jgi:phytoene dehydrogenase-like protein
MTRAVVVGSGPNGLAAAATLAAAGVAVHVIEAADELGGGARNSEPPMAGLIQDHCAAFHPMAAASPYLRGLDLPGVEWALPEIDCAHPLDDGDAVLLRRSIADTADGLGRDGWRWRTMFGAPSATFSALSEDILRPLVGIPRHPLLLARFGAVAAPPPTWVARAFSQERTRALFLGVAAHAFQRLDQPLVTGIGAGIITAGHAVGWPVIKGGTGALTAAVIARLRERGVTFETGTRIRSRRQLPPHDIAMLDVHPHAVAEIMGESLPSRNLNAFRRFRPGPAAFKVEFAVAGGVPWRSPQVAHAGTVHLGGSAREIVAAERESARGRMPTRPFVLVGQQYVADPQRSVGDVHPVYAYAHVPAGYTGDATEAIVAQFERFAPGFTERVLATRVVTATDLSRENPNFVGGDILTGAKSPLQFTLGPRVSAQPYDTGVPGYYICSAATPPGPGVHGLCGVNAARRALRGVVSREIVASTAAGRS